MNLDQALDELTRWERETASLRAQLAALQAENERLRAALQRIGQVDNETGEQRDDVCWECQGWVLMADHPRNGRPSCGTDCPGRIARRALANTTPPAPAEPHRCPSCDYDDNIKVPEGKLIASTPIKRAAAQPVAPRPARDIAHEALGDICGDRHERFGHSMECDRLTTRLEADRSQRRAHPGEPTK